MGPAKQRVSLGLPFEREKVEIIIKKPKFKIARTLKPRSGEELLNFGIINLDKPAGPKSSHIGNKLRNLLEQPKIGHSGTLDPKVTGVLPIGLGKAVRVLQVLTTAGKVYRGTLQLHDKVSNTDIQKAFKKFTGIITQLPPKISAVKRVPRKREIYWLKILKIRDRYVDFEVGCEAGTYIRKLCHDIGAYLKVGGHMSALRRIQSGSLKIKDSVSLEVVKANYKRYLKTKQDNYIRKFILPPEKAIGHLQKIWIEDKMLDRFKHGSPIFAPGIIAFTSNLKKDATTAIFNQSNNLIGFGFSAKTAEQLETAEKGLAIKTDVVFI